MSETSPLLAAILTDRYRIERQIGQGGMATVYLAEDLKLERDAHRCSDRSECAVLRYRGFTSAQYHGRVGRVGMDSTKERSRHR